MDACLNFRKLWAFGGSYKNMRLVLSDASWPQPPALVYLAPSTKNDRGRWTKQPQVHPLAGQVSQSSSTRRMWERPIACSESAGVRMAVWAWVSPYVKLFSV